MVLVDQCASSNLGIYNLLLSTASVRLLRRFCGVFRAASLQ